MEQVQVLESDWASARPVDPSEGRVVTVNLLCVWPSSATEEEVMRVLDQACRSARAKIGRKLQPA